MATLTLTPIRGVAPNGEDPAEWLALDTDPQFELSSLEHLAGAWVRLVADIAPASGWISMPALHFDCGAGYTDHPSIVLPQPRAGSTRLQFVFRVPGGLRRVRFDPLGQAGAFRLVGPSVRRLSTLEARFAMVADLVRTRGLVEAAKAVVRALRRWRLRDGVGELNRTLADRYTALSGVDRHGYAHWIAAFEPPASSYGAIAASQREWAQRPLISIVMPVWNPPSDVFIAALESIRAQVYPHWELCIADDASDKPHVRELIERFGALDSRIKVEFRQHNGHIVAASNSALVLATGQYVALMDHDDLLHPLALHYIAEAIDRNPEAAIVFSDEDKLDAAGRRHSPYFKCEFNYELFLSQNMVSHLGVYRRDLVTLVGGFREETRGSQDHDLALRVLERIELRRIVHVPRVLYHWRAIAGSTARGSDEKPYAVAAARRAIADHLRRIGVQAEVLPAAESAQWSRVRHALPDPLPHVTIVVTARERSAGFVRCVESIFRCTAHRAFDVVVVDAAGLDPADVSRLRSVSADRLRILKVDAGANHSTMNNLAVALADGDFVCLLDSAVEATSDSWLGELLSFAALPDVGVVGARLWSPDQRLIRGGMVLGLRGIAGTAHLALRRGDGGYFGRAILHQQMSAVSASGLVVRKSVWVAVGGLDEALDAFNDVDFCLRTARAGHRTIWTPFAELVCHDHPTGHRTEASRRHPERLARETDLIHERWASQLAADPAYSPNLSLLDESFGLAWPPRQTN
ncbi:N/A [soil metagenome]